MASSRQSYLMVGRESTVATAVTPTHPLRYKDGDILYNLEVIANNPIQGVRWNPINAVDGKVTTDGTYNTDLDYNEGVHFIAAGLGTLVSADISSGTDGSVYSHTINTANALPSLTIEQGKGNLDDTSNNLQNYEVSRAYGVLVDKFTLEGSDNILSMAVDLKAHGVFNKADLITDAAAGASVDIELDSVEGLTTNDTVNIYDTTPQNETDAIASISASPTNTIQIATLGNTYTVANNAKVELVPQTPSYSTLAKVASFTHCSFQFGDTAIAAAAAPEENIEEWSFEYENQLEERFGSLRNSPSVIAPKGAMATLSFTKYFENVTDRDRYLNLEPKYGILTVTNNEIVSGTDTNQAKYEMKITMNKVIFETYEMPTGTDDLYAASVTAKCFYNETDGKALEIVFQNAKAGTEYTTA